MRWLIKVSSSHDEITSQALQQSREWTSDEVGLQAATENWQWWCGHDVVQQRVSDVSTSNREARSLTVDSVRWTLMTSTLIVGGIYSWGTLTRYDSICKPECTCTESVLKLSANVDEGVEWPLQQSSSLTGAAWVGRTGCQLEWHCHYPDVTVPKTLQTRTDRDVCRRTLLTCYNSLWLSCFFTDLSSMCLVYLLFRCNNWSFCTTRRRRLIFTSLWDGKYVFILDSLLYMYMVDCVFSLFVFIIAGYLEIQLACWWAFCVTRTC